ncbi:hypothetical protein [Cryobacterium breve]|uniref:hypothetical protein n=1 Tax=Cryobacterium breve TaxID=1259258 RepID=UPI00248BE102|nr:hypothetical protein [Cryobacterium breve]
MRITGAPVTVAAAANPVQAGSRPQRLRGRGGHSHREAARRDPGLERDGRTEFVAIELDSGRCRRTTSSVPVA